MTFQAFVDETKAGGLTLVATVVAGQDIARARAEMKAARPNRARRIHFRKDGREVKNRALEIIRCLPVSIYAVDMRSLGEGVEARRAGLREMVPALVALGVTRLIIERDESMDDHDKRELFSIAAGSEMQGVPFQYDHVPPQNEPLLWVSDGVAWCLRNKDSYWRKQVTPMVRALPPSSRSA